MNNTYLKHALWDFILVAAAAIALCYILLDGFYVDPALRYGPLPAIIALACLVALFGISYSKRAMLIGGIAYGVVLLLAWIICAILTPNGAILVDNESNYLIFCMVATLTPTACYLLSRTMVGTAALFIAGAFLVGLIQLFYQQFELAATIVFVLATLALLVYGNYKLSLRNASSLKKASFIPGFAVAGIASLVAVGLGVGVWFGIIAPLSPGAAEIKLVTEYRALETVQVKGTSDVYQRPNLDITSDVTNEGERTTDDIKESLDGTPWPATGEAEDKPEDSNSEGSFTGLNLDNFQESFDLQSRPVGWTVLFFLIPIVALIVLYFVGRRVLRNRRLEKMRAMGKDKEFKQAFLFLLERMKRLGVKVPEGQTMLEFGKGSKSALYYQDSAAGVAFENLANSYSGMVYGNRSATDEDIKGVESYYRNFWKACHKQLGSVKYFFKSFRL